MIDDAIDFRYLTDGPITLPTEADNDIDKTFTTTLSSATVTRAGANAMCMWDCRKSGSGANVNYTIKVNNNIVIEGQVSGSQWNTRQEAFPASVLNAGGENSVEVRFTDGTGKFHFRGLCILYKKEVQT